MSLFLTVRRLPWLSLVNAQVDALSEGARHSDALEQLRGEMQADMALREAQSAEVHANEVLRLKEQIAELRAQ
eukprot:4288392-Pleurochrysis_carterae.AAC.1